MERQIVSPSVRGKQAAMNSEITVKFDMETGREMTDSFSFTGGIPCRLYSADGKIVYSRGMETDGCTVCRAMARAAGVDFKCEGTHKRAAKQAERFGGRYIYFCPSSMMFFASPIITGGALSGALVGGPVLCVEVDDYLDSGQLGSMNIDPAVTDSFRAAYAAVPRVEPHRLSHMSNQLFASAVCVSDSSHELFLSQNLNKQQNTIGEFIQQLKSEDDAQTYPIDKEQALVNAVSHGDRPEAGRLLNEILGYIFFITGGAETAQTRVTELIVMLSRAVIYCGADIGTTLKMTEASMRQIGRLHTLEDMAGWLSRILNQYLNLVFVTGDSKHANSIHKAVEYMNRNYASRLTLGEVAAHVGYSPAYFSRVFKDEMHSTFRVFLNEMRVEKSKPLLLAGNASISDICNMIGFEEQSYYCKVFRRITGVTPDKFRKRSRRIDREKEYGL